MRAGRIDIKDTALFPLNGGCLNVLVRFLVEGDAVIVQELDQFGGEPEALI